MPSHRSVRKGASRCRTRRVTRCSPSPTCRSRSVARWPSGTSRSPSVPARASASSASPDPGKTLVCRSILGVPPPGVTIAGGSITLGADELTSLTPRGWQRVRGRSLSAVFQDPASYLNPSITIGRQLAEQVQHTRGLRRRAARPAAIELLRAVGLRNPDVAYGQFPHELSGGMLQRILIAIAIAGEPRLLVADEATTALDVAVQAEVLDLLASLRRRVRAGVAAGQPRSRGRLRGVRPGDRALRRRDRRVRPDDGGDRESAAPVHRGAAAGGVARRLAAPGTRGHSRVAAGGRRGAGRLPVRARGARTRSMPAGSARSR